METFIIGICLCIIVVLSVLLWRRESTISELRGSLDSLGVQLREQRTRANLAERTVAAARYRLTECSRAAADIAARNGTAREIVSELKKRFNEMEDLLFGSNNNINIGSDNNRSDK